MICIRPDPRFFNMDPPIRDPLTERKKASHSLGWRGSWETRLNDRGIICACVERRPIGLTAQEGASSQGESLKNGVVASPQAIRLPFIPLVRARRSE